MQILRVCLEMFLLSKTSGLVDTVGVLPVTQIADGVDVHILLPAFPDIRRGATDAQVVSRRDTFAGHITLLFGHYNGVSIYLIDAPHLYDRPGSPYHGTNLFAYTDNVLRSALLGWVGTEMASGFDPFWRPDVMYAHDWYADLAPAHLAAHGRPVKSVFIVYNLVYQGMSYAHHMNDIQLSWSFFNTHGPESNGQISLLKVGLHYIDHITVVGPTYAREITEPQFVYGMGGPSQQRHREGRLSGVLSDVDEKTRSSETGLLLASRYARDTSEDKAENKRQLQIAMGLKIDDKASLLAVVSCLTSQKGLDLVLEALPSLLEQGGQPVLLGAGGSVLQEDFFAAAVEYPGQVGVQIGYHEIFSHCIMGGADVILVPSRFGPRGLAQLYGLKYDTLLLVRRIDGFAGTISDCSLENLIDGAASGFVFEDSNARSPLRATRRAFVLWSRPSLWWFM